MGRVLGRKEVGGGGGMVCINESVKGCGRASSLEVRLGSQRSIFLIEDDNR